MCFIYLFIIIFFSSHLHIQSDGQDDQEWKFFSRFFYSTASYALAQATNSTSELPTIGSALYAWPLDLPKPRFVYLLVTTSAVRRERVVRRSEQVGGPEVTEEERKLAVSDSLESRVNECYRRFCETNKADIPYCVLNTSLNSIDQCAEIALQAFSALQA